MDRTLLALKRKLESAELELLRTHTLELAERIERLEAELLVTRNQLINAEVIASMWREAAMERAEEDDAAIGIMKQGELLLFPTITPCIKSTHEHCPPCARDERLIAAHQERK